MESPRPSVDTRLGKIVQLHNYFLFTPIINKTSHTDSWWGKDVP